MLDATGVGDTVAAAANAIFERVVDFLPNLLGAVLLLFAGWVIAQIARFATQRAALLLEGLLGKLAGPAGAERLKVGRSSRMIGTIMFWIVLLFFVTASTQVLGLKTFTDWLARLLDYLPTLAAGLLIIVAGYILAGFVADLVNATATRLANAQRIALARLAQGATLIAAILVGADQIGVKITFLAILAAIIAAAVVGGVTLAASFGARSYIANLIGAHYLRQAFSVGQRIRVRGYEGSILEVTPVSLVLETPEGRVSLPGHVYHDEAIVLVLKGNDG